MEPLERARLVVAIEGRYREALKLAMVTHTIDADEQIEIASGVLALMLRKMTQQRGQVWLEQVLTMVLKDA